MNGQKVVSIDAAKSKKLKIPYIVGETYFIVNTDLAIVEDKALPVIFTKIETIEGIDKPYLIFKYISPPVSDMGIVTALPSDDTSLIYANYDDAVKKYDELYAEYYLQIPDANTIIFDSILHAFRNDSQSKIIIKIAIDKIRELYPDLADKLIEHGALSITENDEDDEE